MHILEHINAQVSAVRLPLYAVTMTAVPRVDTPVLLMLHWHGFRGEVLPRNRHLPVPGSVLQLNERWGALQSIDAAMLDAGWQLGAWDVEREERRACTRVGASEREALQCRQAFGDYPGAPDGQIVEDAPDREDLMQLGAEVGYVHWQFRPVKGGVWHETADDDTLAMDGSREPPCPVVPLAPRGGRATRTSYRLGRVNRIILL